MRQWQRVSTDDVYFFRSVSGFHAEGLLSYRNSPLGFSRQDRDDLLAYLVKNFGPDAKPRTVRVEQEMPLDEARLGKAMYIEYYLSPDAPGKGVNAPEYNKLQAGFVGRRAGQDVRFDHDGNVWLTDRGYPHRLVKLDPRTGEQKDYELPDPKNGIHEVMVDPMGIDLAAGTLRRATSEREASAGVQSTIAEIRARDSDGSGQRHPEPDQMAAVPRSGFEEQCLRWLDHGRSAEQVRQADREGVGLYRSAD
jgi:hypothetical protein